MSYAMQYYVKIKTDKQKQMRGILTALKNMEGNDCMNFKINGTDGDFSKNHTEDGFLEYTFTFEYFQAETFKELINLAENPGESGYGIVLSDSDYGVNVDAVSGLTQKECQTAVGPWASGDFTTLTLSIPESVWAKILDCGEEEIEDNLEDMESFQTALQKLLGAETTDGILGLSFNCDLDIASLEEYDCGEAVFSLRLFDGWKTDQIESYRKLFTLAAEKIHTYEGSIKINFSEEDQAETACNAMINGENFQLLEFTTTENTFGEIHKYAYSPLAQV